MGKRPFDRFQSPPKRAAETRLDSSIPFDLSEKLETIKGRLPDSIQLSHSAVREFEPSDADMTSVVPTAFQARAPISKRKRKKYFKGSKSMTFRISKRKSGGSSRKSKVLNVTKRKIALERESERQSRRKKSMFLLKMGENIRAYEEKRNSMKLKKLEAKQKAKRGSSSQLNISSMIRENLRQVDWQLRNSSRLDRSSQHKVSEMGSKISQSLNHAMGDELIMDEDLTQLYVNDQQSVLFSSQKEQFLLESAPMKQTSRIIEYQPASEEGLLQEVSPFSMKQEPLPLTQVDMNKASPPKFEFLEKKKPLKIETSVISKNVDESVREEVDRLHLRLQSSLPQLEMHKVPDNCTEKQLMLQMLVQFFDLKS